MLRSCICLKKERRDSSNSSTSSCRSSEIERNAAAISNSSDERESRSFMKYLSSSICFRVMRSPRRGLSMTKVERGKLLRDFHSPECFLRFLGIESENKSHANWDYRHYAMFESLFSRIIRIHIFSIFISMKIWCTSSFCQVPSSPANSSIILEYSYLCKSSITAKWEWKGTGSDFIGRIFNAWQIELTLFLTKPWTLTFLHELSCSLVARTF